MKQTSSLTLIIQCIITLIAVNGYAYSAYDTHANTRSDSLETPKEWTFIVYMSADNDLRGFAARNIKQMAAIGSNEFVNILVQLDIKISGNKKVTRRYYIENNKILHVNGEDPSSQRMDSGDPQTLVSCCSWAIRNYPAEHYALIFWNHGTGPLDPASGRIINPTELFTFNPTNNKFELDRTVGFFDFISADEHKSRGICWDDSTGNYLTNQKLESALEEIQINLLQGQRFAIIGFDACLMSTLEIAHLIKKYADIMVGSQEVELGTGWNYQRALSLFQAGAPSPEQLSEHIVNMYGATYNTVTDDYTQSAINLRTLDDLENNIHTIANVLMECLKYQANSSVKNAIMASRSKEFCTHFDEPSYLDLHHFYTNLQANLSYFELSSHEHLKHKLERALMHGQELIKGVVIANITGKNLRLAQGISIYFPERRIHYSYKKVPFAMTQGWYTFLMHYLTL